MPRGMRLPWAVALLFSAVFLWSRWWFADRNYDVSNERRALAAGDGPIQFLSNLIPRKSVAADKPLEFLSQEHIDKARGSASSPKKNMQEKPLEFMDLRSTKKTAETKKSPAAKPIEFVELVPEKKTQVEDKKTNIRFRQDASSTKGQDKPAQKKPKGKDEYLNIHEPIEFVNPHPVQSPREGTDISPIHQMTLLKCPKQSTCIVPELQLAKKLKVYLCKHPTKHGVRFYYLAREGLLLHPGVELVTEDRINEADYIFYLPGSAPWHLTEVTDHKYASRLIVLDEFDGHQLISPTITPEQYVERYGGRNKPWYFMYFKRSFVRRLDGDFKRYPHFAQPDVYPMTYAIAEAYIPAQFNFQREIDILCTLRGTKAMTTRMRAQTWVAEYGVARGIKDIITSQVNTATRTTVSMAYFQQMFNSRIIVTVNPADWEGDFRLWESLCTGALVFVDPLYVPHPFPLVGGEHIVYFDNNNKTDLWSKLDFYRANPQEARRVAINGYLYAMKYHRTVSMIDYILRSAHLKTAMVRKEPLPRYYYSAQYLNYEAAAQEKAMVVCKAPGNYAPVPSDHHIANLSSVGGSSYVHPIKRLTCSALSGDAGKAHSGAGKVGNIRFGGS